MQLIVRQVRCICTGGHTFTFERALFKDMKPVHVTHRIICTKCGAYIIRHTGSWVDTPEGISEEPDARMYQYWREQKE